MRLTGLTLGLLGLAVISCQGKSEQPTNTTTLGANATTSCARLQATVCTELGQNSGVCGLFRNNEFPESRCQTMLRDLTQSLKELRQLEQSRQPLDHDVAARIAASDAPSFGDSDAKVTVVLFSDYDCKSCLPVGHYVPLLSQHYGPKELRVVFRQYPVSGGKFSRLSAESSLAAAAQKRFLPYHECLYNNQHDLNPASIERCAQESKLERSRFQAEMQEHRYEPQVSSDLTLGREALVGVVPYLFVNGQRFNGTRGVEDLRKLIDESLAQSASTNAVAATAQPKPAEVY